MRKVTLFDTVKIKDTGEVGFVSSMIDKERIAVNTGDPDNQPVVKAEDVEILDD